MSRDDDVLDLIGICIAVATETLGDNDPAVVWQLVDELPDGSEAAFVAVLRLYQDRARTLGAEALTAAGLAAARRRCGLT